MHQNAVLEGYRSTSHWEAGFCNSGALCPNGPQGGAESPSHWAYALTSPLTGRSQTSVVSVELRLCPPFRDLH